MSSTAQTTSNENGQPIVQVENLCTHFPIRAGVFSRTVGYIKAVDGVSFSVEPGKTLGLVGESGCGKTTVGRTMLRLIPATSGTVRYKGLTSSLIAAKRCASFAARCRSSFRIRSAASILG